jgi:hypothetical protein
MIKAVTGVPQGKNESRGKERLAKLNARIKTESAVSDLFRKSGCRVRTEDGKTLYMMIVSPTDALKATEAYLAIAEVYHNISEPELVAYHGMPAMKVVVNQ